MKKLILFLLLLPLPVYASWVDSWFDNATATTGSAGMIKGSARTYYSAPYSSIRWQTKVDYPISIGFPRVSAGCGGIDIFMGSMDLMNFDYLVKRLKNIMYTAGAFAFQYALSRLNPKANQLLQALDATANFLNSLQLDECRAGKAIAVKLMSPFSSEAAKDLGTGKIEIEQVLGVEDTWKQAVDAWKQTLGSGQISKAISLTDKNRLTAGCPSSLEDFAYRGSLISYLANRGFISTNFAPVIRGLVGDVVVNQDGSSMYVPGCEQKFSDLVEATLNGTIQKCTLSGNRCLCSSFTEGARLLTRVQNHLSTYLNGLKAKGRINTNTQAFVRAISYYPVHNLIKMAYQSGVSSSFLASDSALVQCSAQFYAAGLLANALNQAERLDKAISTWISLCSNADAGRCMFCKSDRINQLRENVRTFIRKARDMLLYQIRVQDLARRSEACLAVEKQISLITKLAEIEQKYYLGARK